MPDFSKMFAKRLGEDNYKSITSFLDGKVKFNELGKDSQNVLNGLERPDHDRTFTQQEQLYELKQKLITDQWIAPDSDAWDKFETTYRMFILGDEARKRFFNVKDLFTTEDGEGYKPYLQTRDENYKAYKIAEAKQKWETRVEKDFLEDLRVGNLDEFKKDFTTSELRERYISGYFEGLQDPTNLEEIALEYRKDMGIKPRQGVEMTELVPQSKISKISKFRPETEPLLSSPPTEFGEVLNKFMETNPMDFTFGVKGLTVNATQFSNWVKSQAEGSIEGIGLNLMTGYAVTKMLDFIAKHSHMTAKQAHVMNFAVTEGLAGSQLMMAESEVGALIAIGALSAQPVISLLSWLRSPGKRRVDNDNPEKIYGKQFARVRSEDEKGNVVWYPAILASKDEWTGIGSSEQNIRLNYGKLEDLHWRYNKDGTFAPYFANPRYKLINATNKDLQDYGSETLRMKYDPLRDYSLLTNDETGDLFGKLMRGEDLSEFKEHIDDRSKQPKYIQELTSYRDDMEYIRTFDLGGEKIGRGLNPADRAIRREFEHSVLSDPKYIEGSGIYFDMQDDSKYKEGFTKYKGKLRENKALLNYFNSRMQDLLRSQRTASTESGFSKVLKGGDFNYSDDHFNYLLYSLDTGFAPAQSLNELKAQNSKTQARTDLQFFEKDYIQQKNIVRYLANKLSQRALGGDIVHTATYPHQETYRLDSPPYDKTGLNYAGILNANGTLRLKQEDKTSVFGNPPGPWSNSDEKTIPNWLFQGEYRGHIINANKTYDYKAESDKLNTRFQQNFLNPYLSGLVARGKYKPSAILKASNPALFAPPRTIPKKDPKFRGEIGKGELKHPYDRKQERLYSETAQEKKDRLKAEKFEGRPEKPKHNIRKKRDPFYFKNPDFSWDVALKQYVPKKAEEFTQGDPTNRRDPYYYKNKNFSWDITQKRYISRGTFVPPKPKSKPFTFEQLKKQDTFGGHGTVQTKTDKKDRKKETRKQELDKQRALERMKRSSDRATREKAKADKIAKRARLHQAEMFKRQEEARQQEKKKHGFIHGMSPLEWRLYQKHLQDVKTVPKVDPYSALREYLSEQHNVDIPKNKPIDPKQYPWLAMTEKGKPALFGDHALHDKLKLGDAYRVVTSKTGVIHTAYDASKVQPKFFKPPHESSVVETY